MIEQDLVMHFKEKTREEYNKAMGIWDLALGLMVIFYAIGRSLNTSYIFAVCMPIVFKMISDAQKKYIYPRFGRAYFDYKAQKQDRLFFAILMYLLVMLGFPLVLVRMKTGAGAMVNPESLTFYLSVLCCLIVALGGFLRRTLFYIYGGAIYLPLIAGLFIPNKLIVIGITALTLLLVFVLLKIFVYDWSGLDRAQQKPGIVGHYLVCFIALGVLAYLIIGKTNPHFFGLIKIQFIKYEQFYAGIATAVIVFLVGYAYNIKSFFYYSIVIILFSIVYFYHIISRPYFLGLFMLFGGFMMLYRLFILERFIRRNPIVEE